MDHVTSRGFDLHEHADDMSTVWFNVWRRRYWPYHELQEDDVLWWFETSSQRIVWRTVVRQVDAFAYDDGIESAISRVENVFGVGQQRDQSYLAGRPPQGYVLAYAVQATDRVEVEKPAGLRFSQNGWERGDRPEVDRWLAAARTSTNGEAARIADHVRSWLAGGATRQRSATSACRDYQRRASGAAPLRWPRYREEFGRQLMALDPKDLRGPSNVLRGLALQARVTVGTGDGGEAFRRWAWAHQPVLARSVGIIPPESDDLPPLLPFVMPPRPVRPRSAAPSSADVELVWRGLEGHHDTVDRLRRWASDQGWAVRAAGPGTPRFDLAWEIGGRLVVAEVKSTTTENEEEQLRLGLGQVLRYRHLLARGRDQVEAWLVPEREPGDPSWEGTCRDVGVTLFVPP